jgi:hypothetical protein
LEQSAKTSTLKFVPQKPPWAAPVRAPITDDIAPMVMVVEPVGPLQQGSTARNVPTVLSCLRPRLAVSRMCSTDAEGFEEPSFIIIVVMYFAVCR